MFGAILFHACIISRLGTRPHWGKIFHTRSHFPPNSPPKRSHRNMSGYANRRVCGDRRTTASKLINKMNDKLNHPTTGGSDAPAKHPKTCQRSPKWAAVVNDALVLLPKQHVTAQLIKQQAG